VLRRGQTVVHLERQGDIECCSRAPFTVAYASGRRVAHLKRQRCYRPSCHRLSHVGDQWYGICPASLGIVVADAAFRLMGIEPRGLQRTADSGRTNTRLVCPEYGSWVCPMPRDGLRRVRAGGHSRRYILAPSDQAHLDLKKTALDRAARRQRDLRKRRRCVRDR
jgi:hypothetical protein